MIIVFPSALHVQWAKSRARSRRWNEEVQLLKEEMRRVLAYFDYKAAWWVERGDGENREVGPELAEGLRAYAEDQAQLQRSLACKFETKWEVIRQDGITTEQLEGLATVVQEDDELDGAGTGSEEEEDNSDEENNADMSDDDTAGNDYS
jgi:hypothetical protein